MIGDSHAALFGQRGFLPGSIKATYGTGSSLMTPTKELRISDRGLSSTVAWGLKDITYALEGNISVTGSAVQWFGQFLGVEAPAQRVAELAQEVIDTAGVYLVPAFVGLGAPHWNEAARGMICGMTRGTTSAHVARAVIESIAYQVRDVFDAMQEEAGPYPELSAGRRRRDPQRPIDAISGGHPQLCGFAKFLARGFAAWGRLLRRTGNRLLVQPCGHCRFASPVRALRAQDGGNPAFRPLWRLADGGGAGQELMDRRRPAFFGHAIRLLAST